MKTMMLMAVMTMIPATSFAAGVMKSTPELLQKGKASYATNCLACHGEKGDGMGPAGQFMNPKPRHFGKDKFKLGKKPQNVFDGITRGLPGTSMTGYAHLPEDERWGLAYYVLSFANK